MTFRDVKTIIALIFALCGVVVPAAVIALLWLMPIFFQQLGGAAITGYFTLAESLALIVLYLYLGPEVALCLLREFCAAESQGPDPLPVMQRNGSGDVLETIQMLGLGRAYIWLAVLLAVGVFSFYAASLLSDLYLDIGAPTLLLAFISLATLSATLIVFLSLPCILQAREILDPAALLAQLSRDLQARRQHLPK